MEQMQEKNKPAIFRGEHPSGLTDEGELAFVSMEFWMHKDNITVTTDESGKWAEPTCVWQRLLAFQQGWKACMDFYKINT